MHVLRSFPILKSVLFNHRDILILSFAVVFAIGSSSLWYLYTTLLDDVFTKPITVRLAWIPDAEEIGSERVDVARRRLQAEFAAIPRTGSATWYTPSGLARDLRIEMPEASVSDIESVTVEIGEESYRWSGAELTREWRSSRLNGVTRLTAPEDVRYGRSILPRVSELRNLDFAALRRGLFLAGGLTVLLAFPAFLAFRLRRRIDVLGFFAYPVLAFVVSRVDAPPVISAAGLGILLFSAVVLSAAYVSALRSVPDGQKVLLRKYAWLVIAFSAIAFAANSSDQLKTSAIRTDSAQNTAMAFNLSRHGIISGSSAADPSALSPTNHREPFPPIIHAFYMSLHPKLSTAESVKELTERGETARAVKGINVGWVFIVLLLTGVLTFKPTRSVPLSVLSMYLVYAFMASKKYMDGLPTELPAAALLLCSALTIIWAVEKQSIGFFALYGLSLGLLVLTKAVFFYIGMVALPFVAVLLWLRRRWPLQAVALRIGVAALIAVAIVLPWMLRNQVRIGHFELSGRGPLVLLVRAHLSDMSDTEWRGSFYAYGSSLAQAILGPLQGFTEADLDEGGRLERLTRRANDENDRRAERAGNPQQAVSYYRTARAERTKLIQEFRAQGVDEPGRAADEVIMDRAVSMIRSNPIGHLRTTLSFAWRGIWAFDSSSPIGDLVNFMSWIAFVAFAIRWAIKRDSLWLSSVMLPVGMLLFYAVASHNLSRYNGPLIPFFAICLVLAIRAAVIYLGARVSGFQSGAPGVEQRSRGAR
jgi:hypothetical protein